MDLFPFFRPDDHNKQSPPEDWGKLVGNVSVATAFLDRFLHGGEIVQITGRSHRLRRRPVDNTATPTKPESDEPKPAHRVEANKIAAKTH